MAEKRVNLRSFVNGHVIVTDLDGFAQGLISELGKCSKASDKQSLNDGFAI